MTIRRTSIALALCLLTAQAQAHTYPKQQPALDDALALEQDTAASVQWLKAAYLHCDRAMSSQRVDAAFAQRCSVVGEQLMRRAFGGDFARLIEWWQGERRSAAAPAR